MRTPTRPICVVLEWHGHYSALLVNPKGKVISDSELDWTAVGPNEAIGKIEDKGYELSRVLKATPPKWVVNRVPNGYNIIGTCNITSFPF